MPRTLLPRWEARFALVLGILALAGCGLAPTAARPPASAASTGPTMAEHAGPPTVAGAWLKTTTKAARPGSTVLVTGYIPGAQPATASAQAGSYANLCFGGCAAGLTEAAVPVHWSKTAPGQFTMALWVPATAWLTPQGPQALENGTYRVSVQCVALTPGCAQRPGEASTVVHVTGVHYRPCPKTACATLTLSLSRAEPGNLVAVHGWAPLQQIIGTAFPYNLVMLPGQATWRYTVATPSKGGSPPSAAVQIASLQQRLDGTFSGSFRVPAALPGSGQVHPGTYTMALQATLSGKSFTVVTLAPAGLQVEANPSWASLGRLSPIASTWSASVGMATLSSPAGSPDRIAACGVNGAILLSSDGGKIWSALPDQAVVQAAARTSYPLATMASPQHTATCNSVLLDSAHPDTVYASFSAAYGPYHSIPPIFTVGYVTTNLGRSWQAVPPPAGFTLGEFSGFQPAGAATLALFASPAAPGSAAKTAVLATLDGGLTWTPSHLTCPSLGPCLRFGPAPSETGGMGAAFPQPLLWSSDAGSSWQAPAWPSQVVLNQGPSELVALSQTRALLLSGASQYTLRATSDGGRHWQNIALPAVPDAQNGASGLPDAVILPSGALLAQNPNTQTWILLPPLATAWCPVTALPTGFVSQPAVIGARLWYVRGTSGGQAVGSTALSAVRCGG